MKEHVTIPIVNRKSYNYPRLNLMVQQQPYHVKPSDYSCKFNAKSK
jgi:hypothetical protein